MEAIGIVKKRGMGTMEGDATKPRGRKPNFHSELRDWGGSNYTGKTEEGFFND